MDGELFCCVTAELSYYCVTAWFVNMLLTAALLPLLLHPLLPSPRPKLPFLPFWWIWWGLNGHGTHDGP